MPLNYSSTSYSFYDEDTLTDSNTNFTFFRKRQGTSIAVKGVRIPIIDSSTGERFIPNEVAIANDSIDKDLVAAIRAKDLNAVPQEWWIHIRLRGGEEFEIRQQYGIVEVVLGKLTADIGISVPYRIAAS